MQGRQKWFDVCRNLAVGDIVLIVNENCKHGNWPKAIVQEIFRDLEGLVRRARVGTAGSSVTRDVRKLCLIEGNIKKEHKNVSNSLNFGTKNLF